MCKVQETERTCRTGVKETGVNAEIVKVEDFDEILNYGIMIIPGLVVDGDVKGAGKVPGPEDIRKWITE